jgi:hypothetical protein
MTTDTESEVAWISALASERFRRPHRIARALLRMGIGMGLLFGAGILLRMAGWLPEEGAERLLLPTFGAVTLLVSLHYAVDLYATSQLPPLPWEEEPRFRWTTRAVHSGAALFAFAQGFAFASGRSDGLQGLPWLMEMLAGVIALIAVALSVDTVVGLRRGTVWPTVGAGLAFGALGSALVSYLIVGNMPDETGRVLVVVSTVCLAVCGVALLCLRRARASSASAT